MQMAINVGSNLIPQETHYQTVTRHRDVVWNPAAFSAYKQEFLILRVNDRSGPSVYREKSGTLAPNRQLLEHLSPYTNPQGTILCESVMG